ncbi:hypothetical protein DFJ73DRAFT_959934 [Zopfochytrium polystomum]|nr:hypothetical protein DFJ73DRAFT_959934 [Zopfochytrium polystomum]
MAPESDRKRNRTFRVSPCVWEELIKEGGSTETNLAVGGGRVRGGFGLGGGGCESGGGGADGAERPQAPATPLRARATRCCQLGRVTKQQQWRWTGSSAARARSTGRRRPGGHFLEAQLSEGRVGPQKVGDAARAVQRDVVLVHVQLAQAPVRGEGGRERLDTAAEQPSFVEPQHGELGTIPQDVGDGADPFVTNVVEAKVHHAETREARPFQSQESIFAKVQRDLSAHDPALSAALVHASGGLPDVHVDHRGRRAGGDEPSDVDISVGDAPMDVDAAFAAVRAAYPTATLERVVATAAAADGDGGGGGAAEAFAMITIPAASEEVTGDGEPSGCGYDRPVAMYLSPTATQTAPVHRAVEVELRRRFPALARVALGLKKCAGMGTEEAWWRALRIGGADAGNEGKGVEQRGSSAPWFRDMMDREWAVATAEKSERWLSDYFDGLEGAVDLGGCPSTPEAAVHVASSRLSSSSSRKPSSAPSSSSCAVAEGQAVHVKHLIQHSEAQWEFHRQVSERSPRCRLRRPSGAAWQSFKAVCNCQNKNANRVHSRSNKAIGTAYALSTQSIPVVLSQMFESLWQTADNDLKLAHQRRSGRLIDDLVGRQRSALHASVSRSRARFVNYSDVSAIQVTPPWSLRPSKIALQSHATSLHSTTKRPPSPPPLKPIVLPVVGDIKGSKSNAPSDRKLKLVKRQGLSSSTSVDAANGNAPIPQTQPVAGLALARNQAATLQVTTAAVATTRSAEARCRQDRRTAHVPGTNRTQAHQTEQEAQVEQQQRPALVQRRRLAVLWSGRFQPGRQRRRERRALCLRGFRVRWRCNVEAVHELRHHNDTHVEKSLCSVWKCGSLPSLVSGWRSVLFSIPSHATLFLCLHVAAFFFFSPLLLWSLLFSSCSSFVGC